MPLERTKVILLKKKDFREYDRIFLVYSKNLGKMELLARGTRKITSKLAGSLEPYALGEVTYTKSLGFEQITSVRVLKSYKKIKSDYCTSIWLYSLTEIIEKYIRPKSHEQEIFLMLESLMYGLEENIISQKSKKNRVLILSALMKLVRLLGFQPQFYYCLDCLKKMKPGKNYFSLAQGGLLCPCCQAKDNQSFLIKDEIIKIIRVFLSDDFSRINRLNIKKDDLTNLKDIIFKYLSYILEKEIKTFNYIKFVDS